MCIRRRRWHAWYQEHAACKHSKHYYLKNINKKGLKTKRNNYVQISELQKGQHATREVAIGAWVVEPESLITVEQAGQQGLVLALCRPLTNGPILSGCWTSSGSPWGECIRTGGTRVSWQAWRGHQPQSSQRLSERNIVTRRCPVHASTPRERWPISTSPQHASIHPNHYTQRNSSSSQSAAPDDFVYPSDEYSKIFSGLVTGEELEASTSVFGDAESGARWVTVIVGSGEVAVTEEDWTKGALSATLELTPIACCCGCYKYAIFTLIRSLISDINTFIFFLILLFYISLVFHLLTHYSTSTTHSTAAHCLYNSFYMLRTCYFYLDTIINQWYEHFISFLILLFHIGFAFHLLTRCSTSTTHSTAAHCLYDSFSTLWLVSI